jgi:ribonucleoside-diphosphate reductase alpha chain
MWDLTLDGLDDPVGVLRCLNEIAVTDVTTVDWDAIRDTVRILVRALDNTIETSLAHYPSTVSSRVMGTKRKIGVGVCGLANLLLAAGLPYDSPEGRQLAQEILAFINYTSKLASVELATRRGSCAAVRTGRSRYADPAFLTRFAGLQVRSVAVGNWEALAEQIAQTGLLRNSSTIAIPPTGRSAPVVGASTGIEPLFRLTDPHLSAHLHPAARSVLEQAGRSDLLGHVMTHGRLPEDSGLPAPLATVLVTATQIAPSGHLAMAAAVQAWVDEAVSKTVNLPPPRGRSTSTTLTYPPGNWPARALPSTSMAPAKPNPRRCDLPAVGGGSPRG